MVRALRKSFGNPLVLDGIDLDVTEGTVHALFGPNGSGKTHGPDPATLLPADAGHDVAGEPGQVRKAIGVTGQFSTVDYLLTGEERLEEVAEYSQLQRWSTPTAQVSRYAAASGAVHRAYCLNLGEVVEALVVGVGGVREVGGF